MSNEDTSILGRIGELVSEERKLRALHIGRRLDEGEQRRLQDIEVELDRCWDLLNQRRALDEYEMDPNQASPRDADTVEGYQQ